MATHPDTGLGLVELAKDGLGEAPGEGEGDGDL